MATPFKVKIREVLKESFCWHRTYTRRGRSCGFYTFVECECLDCGKVWTE